MSIRRQVLCTLSALLISLSIVIFPGSHSPSLFAQEPVPQDGSDTLFLPQVSGGISSFPTSEIIPNEYIVVLKNLDGAPETRAVDRGWVERTAKQMVEAHGGQLHFVYEAAITGFAATISDQAAAKLAIDPRVEFVEQNQRYRISDEQLFATWGLDRIDQRALPLDTKFTYTYDGTGVHAYVIDTGIRSTHQEFTGRMGAGANFVSDNRGTEDCNNHGTHVAGTIGGTTYGVAKGVTLHPVRVLGCNGSGTTFGVVAGINWVTENHISPAVANMSLGGSGSWVMDLAVYNSIRAGVVYSVAAGNSSWNACNFSPARVFTALTVGASTITDQRASFSNWGWCVNIFAPGQSITSAVATDDDDIATFNGTSMAAPHVAGAAAMVLQVVPNASPADVGRVLVENATAGALSSIGWGSPNRLLYLGSE